MNSLHSGETQKIPPPEALEAVPTPLTNAEKEQIVSYFYTPQSGSSPTRLQALDNALAMIGMPLQDVLEGRVSERREYLQKIAAANAVDRRKDRGAYTVNSGRNKITIAEQLQAALFLDDFYRMYKALNTRVKKMK